MTKEKFEVDEKLKKKSPALVVKLFKSIINLERKVSINCCLKNKENINLKFSNMS